jgi:hypothetical protein
MSETGSTSAAYIEVIGKPDAFGRVPFVAFWWDTNIGPGCDQEGWRGQYFHAEVPVHAAEMRQRGLEVVVTQGCKLGDIRPYPADHTEAGDYYHPVCVVVSRRLAEVGG